MYQERHCTWLERNTNRVAPWWCVFWTKARLYCSCHWSLAARRPIARQDRDGFVKHHIRISNFRRAWLQTKAQCNTNLCKWSHRDMERQFAGRHRWHFLVGCQVVSFLPWETMCPIKGGGGGGGGGPLSRRGWPASGSNESRAFYSSDHLCPAAPSIWAGEADHKTEGLRCCSGIYLEPWRREA